MVHIYLIVIYLRSVNHLALVDYNKQWSTMPSQITHKINELFKMLITWRRDTLSFMSFFGALYLLFLFCVTRARCHCRRAAAVLDCTRIKQSEQQQQRR